MRDPSVPPVLALPSRRRFLAGAAAATLLAACGDDDSAGGTDDTTSTTAADVDPEVNPLLSVVSFYGPYFVAGRTNRVPFGIADEDGLLPIDGAPDSVTITVQAPDGSVLADGLTSPIHADGLPRPYYVFDFDAGAGGFYDYTVHVGDEEVRGQVAVIDAEDGTIVDLVGPGDPMPAVPTPTVADARGVSPICTREPPCDLHTVSLDDALGTGPVALMVSTPAFCQTAICGPVLDVLLDQMAPFGDVTFVHAEVYEDPENRPEPSAGNFAPVVGALGLPFEPVLYTVGADGIVRERLDYIFDGADVGAALGRLAG